MLSMSEVKPVFSLTSEILETFCVVCNQVTERKCAACKLVYYCSQDHQKQHWKKHKSVCQAFEVGYSKELGKFLKATRDLKPGDVIFSEYPLVFGPKPHFIDEGLVPCPGCCRKISINSSERCEGCEWPVCSTLCEGLKNPSIHGLECQFLNLQKGKLNGNIYEIYRTDILITMRALLLQFTKKSKWDQIMNLVAHLENRKEDTEIFREVSIKAERIKNLMPNVSLETIHKIYGIFDVNATELTEDYDVEILYPTVSLMEHSCIPNTCQVIDYAEKFKITIKTALPIKKNEHLTSMYTHALWGTAARREHLMKTKYFICKCKRCEDPTELNTFLSALRCLEDCGGFLLQTEETKWNCNTCPASISDEEALVLTDQIGKQVDEMLASDFGIKHLEELLEKLLLVLHPNHYHSYIIKHTLVQMYGHKKGFDDLEILKKKIDICNELIDVTEKLDPGNTRLSIYKAVLLNELFSSKLNLLKFGKIDDIQIDDLKLILFKAENVLENELNTSTGKKLLVVIQKNEENFLNSIKEVNYI